MGAVARHRDSLGAALLRGVTDRSEPVLGLLRRHRPVVSVGRFAAVTRAEDVRAVLRDHEHFTVDHYAPKMAELTGPFILGLDDTPLYRHDDAALGTAFRAEDLPAVAAMTLTAARQRLAGAGGRVDVVADLADPVIDHVIASYLGTPGPDTATQLRWARSLFEHIFLNVGDKPAIRDRALADAGEWRPHLDAQIAAAGAATATGVDGRDDVLTRLVTDPDGLHDIAVRHNLIGVIAGWIPTVSKAFAVAVDELLDRPAELARAQQAARDGDDELVAASFFEALRFRPQTWALLRICTADRRVGGTTIRAGARVLLATQSAMFDERVVAEPRSFRVDRPWSDYLHFGHGLHTCFGLQINRIHLPALATALLEGPPLRRAGRVRWDGPYPCRLEVALG